MRRIALCSILLTLTAAAPAAHAQSDPRWELGPRLVVLNAGGEPSNDQMGFGAALRYSLSDSWRLGFALDSITGDFERPYRLLGFDSPEDIDSTLDALVFSAWLERETGAPGQRLRWYWTAGLGYQSPDLEDVTGARSGGGSFDITTDGGTEILVGVGGGFRLRLGRSWNTEIGIRVDQHFADWKITERVSGQTGSLDDYTTAGLIIGFNYRF
jgi:opacity protein-like surface antigen